MIAAILSLLGSSAVGTILGGIFAFLNKKADLETRKLELSHEVDKWTHDLALRDKDLEYAKQEAQGKIEVAVIETDGASEVARLQAIAVAQAADKITADEIVAAGSWGWLLVAVSAINKIIRPLLTFILAGCAIWVNLVLISRLGDSWATYTAAQQYDAALQAFAWVTGQAGTVIGYWFVARGSSKK